MTSLSIWEEEFGRIKYFKATLSNCYKVFKNCSPGQVEQLQMSTVISNNFMKLKDCH